MNSLTNKIAIITGGSRGIGEATALLFAKHNASVVICGRDLSSLIQTKERIISTYPQATILPIQADITCEKDISSLFKKTIEQFGKLDILVNNAATLYVSPFISQSITEWDHTWSVNVRGSMLCSQEAFKIMKSTGGSIVNVSSLAGVRHIENFPGLSAYSVSKSAIIGLTESLALEGKPYTIRVNAIAPGAVQTDMLKKAAPDYQASTTPEEIASSILFLADSSLSQKVTGSILEIYCND